MVSNISGNIKAMSNLQTKCLRIMNFAPLNSHINNLFTTNQKLKIDDIIKSEQLKLLSLQYSY